MYIPQNDIYSEQVIFECDIKPESTNTYFVRPYTATNKELFTLLYNANDGNKIGYKKGSDGNICSTTYFDKCLC